MQKKIAEYLQQCASKKHWEKIGIEYHHGIAFPLSSIHTHQSSGIGQFQDLYPVIDWCRSIGFHIIQLLPLNDTGLNVSPYSSISANALDPVYLSIPKEHRTLFKKFTQTKYVAYQKVKKLKLKIFREIFKQEFHKLHKKKSFLTFLEKNPWIFPYAQFCYLTEKYQSSLWNQWPKKDQKYQKEKYQKESQFYLYLQYLCNLEMSRVKNYAEKNHVFLKGDIPILLSPNSVDVWAYPHLFSLDFLAGAPPDLFNTEGQKWGFPLFKWKELEKTDYTWWKIRLKTAEKYFHLYRIDHAVGFFRIWAVHPEDPAKKGQFISKNRYRWAFDGERRFRKLLQFSYMLPIAEDLGTIPHEVPIILKKLGICGTRVVRWNRYWDENCEFIPPKDYPILSVTTLGTHDTSLFCEWCNEYPQKAKLLCKAFSIPYKKKFNQELQKSFLKKTHQTSSLFHIHPLQEYLSVFEELTHKDPKKERINIPGTERTQNWTYRFLPTFEKIQSHRKLMEFMQSLAKGEEK